MVSRIPAQQVDVSKGRTINLSSASGLTGSEKRRTRATSLYILHDTLFFNISFLFLFLSSLHSSQKDATEEMNQKIRGRNTATTGGLLIRAMTLIHFVLSSSTIASSHCAMPRVKEDIAGSPLILRTNEDIAMMTLL